MNSKMQYLVIFVVSLILPALKAQNWSPYHQYSQPQTEIDSKYEQFGEEHIYDHEQSESSHLVDAQAEITKIIKIPVIKQKTVPVPYSVPVPMPKPVVIHVAKPYPVQILVPHGIPIPVIKTINIPVEKQIPFPVIKEIPYHYDKPVPVHVEVEKKYPVYVPVYKHIFVPSKTESNDIQAEHKGKKEKKYIQIKY